VLRRIHEVIDLFNAILYRNRPPGLQQNQNEGWLIEENRCSKRAMRPRLRVLKRTSPNHVALLKHHLELFWDFLGRSRHGQAWRRARQCRRLPAANDVNDHGHTIELGLRLHTHEPVLPSGSASQPVTRSFVNDLTLTLCRQYLMTIFGMSRQGR
jgi:hypothetical protein